MPHIIDSDAIRAPEQVVLEGGLADTLPFKVDTFKACRARLTPALPEESFIIVGEHRISPFLTSAENAREVGQIALVAIGGSRASIGRLGLKLHGLSSSDAASDCECGLDVTVHLLFVFVRVCFINFLDLPPPFIRPEVESERELRIKSTDAGKFATRK